MTPPPSFSVVVPHRDSADCLRELARALAGLADSHRRQLELVVVHDASGNSLSALSASQHLAVKEVRLPVRSGPGAARNRGILQASAPVLAFLDADCLPGENWLAGLGEFERRQDTGAAFAAQYNRSLVPGFIGQYAFLELRWRERKLRPGQPLGAAATCNFVCRKRDFEASGGFSEDPLLYPAEDIEFTARFAERFPILWKPEMAVSHHFRKTLFSYLAQQYHYGRASSYFKLRYGFRSRSGEAVLQSSGEFLLGNAAIAAGLLTPLAMPGSAGCRAAAALLAAAALSGAAQFGFLLWLGGREGLFFAIRSLAAVGLRNAAWFLGACRGALQSLGGGGKR